MSIEDVQKEVLHSAENDAHGLKKEAEKKARESLTMAKERGEEMRRTAKDGFRRTLEKERKKAIEAAHFESTAGILRLKKEMIDCSIADAKSQLGMLPAEKRKRHIKTLIERAKQDISVHYVLCAKKDMPYVQGFKVEEAAIAGGIIAENSDRTMRVDLSYDTLFAGVVDENIKGIYDALFGK